MERVQHIEAPVWPPVELVRSTGVQGVRGGWHERAPWPDKSSLDYVQKIVTVGLLLLALPYLVHKLATAPGEVIAGVGERASKGQLPK